MKFKLTITREVIEKSLLCGLDGSTPSMNCAFAKAYNELVPSVSVGMEKISFYKELDHDGILICKIPVTPEQEEFIQKFDSMRDAPRQRFSIVGQEFDVEIPDSVIEYWYQDAAEAAKKIANSPVLKVKEVDHAY